MKKLIALLMMLTFFWAMPVYSADVTITFAWDTDASGGWEKLLFFERDDGGVYDYQAPVFELPQTYNAEGNSEPVTATITSTFPDGVESTKYWVVRAMSGVLQSADSEEVSYLVNLTPLPLPTYTAVFNDQAMSIDFSWPTDADERISSWKIFHKLPADADWVELVTVDDSGSESVPIDALFPGGERTTREFTMVAYGPFGLFSQNAATTSITVNRRPPSGVINFKINLVQ